MNKKGFIYIALAGLILMFSCQKQELGPVLLDDPVAPVLSAPSGGGSLELTEDNAGEMISFEWSAADYGYDAAVSYSVQADLAANSFAEAIELFKTTGVTGSVAYGDLNNALLAAGALAGGLNDIQIRVVSTISDYVDDLVSPVVSLNVRPYFIEVSYPMLNVPGNYQGWDPALETTVLYSLKSDEIYEGYIYFGEAETMFKFAKGTWDVNWGDDGNDGTLEAGAADIPAAGPAQYKLNVDLNTLTYTKEMTAWGLIGSATPNGWDGDQDMTFDVDNNMWTITVDLVAGEVKFRANDDWAINLGDTGANGVLEYDGENIAIADAGNYTITLELGKAMYGYSITKN